MKCPKCGAEMKIYTSDDGRIAVCPDCNAQNKLLKKDNQEHKKDTNKNKGCGCLVLIILVIFIAIGVSTCGSDKKETKNSNKTENTKKDANGWTEDDYINFRATTQQISDNYVANYSSPWGNDDWTFAKFDDTDKVAVMTKYTFKDMPEKQQVLCVFSVSEESFTPHYLSVGNNEYLNDGTCDAVFDKIKSITE